MWFIFSVSHFFLLLWGFFPESANISHEELSLNHILKEYLISKVLQIIRKKRRNRFNQRLFELHRWKFPSDTVMRLGLGARKIQHTRIVCFNFSSGVWGAIIWFITCLIFWSYLLNKWSEAAIHNSGRKIVVL